MEESTLAVFPLPGSFGQQRATAKQEADNVERDESPPSDQNRLAVHALEAWRNAVRLASLAALPKLNAGAVHDFCIWYALFDEHLKRYLAIPLPVRDDFWERWPKSYGVRIADCVGDSNLEAACRFAGFVDASTRLAFGRTQGWLDGTVPPRDSAEWGISLERLDRLPLVALETWESCPDPLLVDWCIEAVATYARRLTAYPELIQGEQGAAVQVVNSKIRGEGEKAATTTNAPLNKSTKALDHRSTINENDSRDKWIYRECCRGAPYKTIASELNKHPSWDPIVTISGVRLAANRFAERHSLPPIPNRKSARASPQ